MIDLSENGFIMIIIARAYKRVFYDAKATGKIATPEEFRKYLDEEAEGLLVEKMVESHND